MAKLVINGDVPAALEVVLQTARDDKDSFFWITSLDAEDLKKEGLIIDGNVSSVTEKLVELSGVTIAEKS